MLVHNNRGLYICHRYLYHRCIQDMRPKIESKCTYAALWYKNRVGNAARYLTVPYRHTHTASAIHPHVVYNLALYTAPKYLANFHVKKHYHHHYYYYYYEKMCIFPIMASLSPLFSLSLAHVSSTPTPSAAPFGGDRERARLVRRDDIDCLAEGVRERNFFSPFRTPL